MCALLGGRAAEAIALHSVSTGAHDDLQRVTDIAYKIVASFGMTEAVGSINVSSPKPEEGRRPYSNDLSELIDVEAQRIVAEAYRRAESVLRANETKLQALAAKLLERETLDYAAIEAVLGPRPAQAAVPGRLM